MRLRSGFPLVFLGIVLIAGPILALSDADTDLLAYGDDNCSNVPNGPNQMSNQVDSDRDGYGNACDTDYDNSLTTNVIDFGLFLATLGTVDAGETDHDGSGTVTIRDFAIFTQKFQSPPGNPGSSGLHCSGQIPCIAFSRRTLNGSGPSINSTGGMPNEIRSASDYDVVVFELPQGPRWRSFAFEMEVGAPGGACAGGAQCVGQAQYRFVGWSSLAEAAASPLVGTVFDLDVTSLVGVSEAYGYSNGGDPNAPPFPTSLVALSIDVGEAGLACPITGCFVALLADVSEAPGVSFQTRISPGPAASDHRLCPLGCEGGLPVGRASIYLRAREY